VLIDKDSYEKILREICKAKILTSANLVERFHISYSLAKKIFNFLLKKKIIELIKNTNRPLIYLKTAV
jgi:ribosomal protein S25